MRRCGDIVDYVIPILCFVAVLVIEYKGARKRAKEYRELEHFAEFLSDLKDCFYLCKSVTESIFRAVERLPGNLRKRLEEIRDVLENETMEVAVTEKQFPGYLKYIRLFMIQCRSAVQYGSGKIGTESVFVKNMTELRRDVQNECYQRKQAMYLFAGLGVITVAPTVFLPVIKRFGMTMMEELQGFYEGKIGTVVVVIFWGITLCCYILLWQVRQTPLGMRNEVLGLQAIVLLLLDVPNLTLMELLDVLGNSAEIFKKSLLRCADEYGANDIAAIERMCDVKCNPEFRQFAGRIAGSERVGLKTAFSDIASDRQYFREQLRLDTEQEQKKKAANAQVLAFIPMMFLLFAYLILPFLVVSLGQMRDIFYEMEQIRFF